ncbi:translation initiation factor subunit beta-like protein [Emericellopsis cladophorae]|uniref:Translation initiation factor eIF2B subunit beta n=1 Tax=Emericellopsis cladophorae TaxID=2686198 RepID=A0A9P9Y5X4_9HYPO|nr:translation initiation factor subunit beta-like protein [Emericellopsis cladophorae]KAI6784168.1 translation initiation factor subunit beta-like protein [Emericellopsis cladophorae]
MPSAVPGFAPTLDSYLRSLKGHAHLDLTIQSLVDLLKRRQISGPEDCALATANCLRQVVAKSKWTDADTLLANVSRAGSKLMRARPNELVIGNIVRRVLGLIRDEATEDRNDGAPSETPSEGQMTPIGEMSQSFHSSAPLEAPRRPGPVGAASSANIPRSLSMLLSAKDVADNEGTISPFGNSGTSTPLHKTTNSQVHALRSEVINGIQEIIDEMGQVDDQIAAHAEVQIRPGDHILVYHPSPTVQRFILRAAQKRKFTLLIHCMPQPRGATGHDKYKALREKLKSQGVQTVVMTTGGGMSYMSRVNKMIIGASAITANGGVVSENFSTIVAAAAKQHRVPIVVLAGVYKLSPECPYTQETAVEFADPMQHVDFSDGSLVHAVEVKAGLTAFLPANLIDTYITNLGTHTWEHLSGLISDHYAEEDVNLHLKAPQDA